MVIRAGNSFSMALTKTQEVYYWGSGYPEKGNGTFYSESRRPKKVEGIGGEVIKIAAGHTFSLALTKEGKVYGWGNILSTLEGHKYGWEETPVLIKGLNLEFVPAIFGSGGHIPNLSDLTKLHRLILGKGIAL
jgi:E3 ubiquitin-protein ligase HERC2